MHAYKWIAADRSESWVRYTLVPQPGEAVGNFKGKHRLRDEIAARLEKSPVRYTLQVAVASATDDPHDPMSVWKPARVFDAGTIEVTGVDEEREQNGEIVVFDPSRIVDGIDLSDDPILRFRPAVYSASVSRRI